MPRFDAALWLPIAAFAVPATAHATQYLTVEQAQRVLFPAAERFAPSDVKLSSEARQRVAAESGVRSRRDEQPVWRAMRGDALIGFFIVDEVIGKHELITYAVGLDPQGVVRGIEILDYRETRGGEVRDPRWRSQFKGKHAGDALRLGQDIQNLSGATLSCRHITDGVRRLVALYDVALKGP
jgi:Na+-translocating ferredoxin:NAD+ oxidoreductase RnfG subunit